MGLVTLLVLTGALMTRDPMYYTLQTATTGEFLLANLRIGLEEPVLLRIEGRKIRIGTVDWNVHVIRHGDLFLTADFVRKEMQWRSEETEHNHWFICGFDGSQALTQSLVTIYTVHHRDELHLSVAEDKRLILTFSYPFEWILQAAA